MNKYLFFLAAIFTLSISISCNDKSQKKEPVKIQEVFNTGKEFSKTPKRKKPEDFLPHGYAIFDTIYGDLNKDNLEDCVFIIKKTDKNKIIKDEYRGRLNRNRRGILVLLNKNDGYELVVKNYECFSSENEDGGVYFAPELYIEIIKGKLVISYGHGRYGYWSYTFRYQNNDLELIGYDASSNHGPTVLSETSINFLTRKKILNENINDDYEGDEVFKKTESKISQSKLIKLSEIEDFDEFEVSEE